MIDKENVSRYGFVKIMWQSNLDEFVYSGLSSVKSHSKRGLKDGWKQNEAL